MTITIQKTYRIEVLLPVTSDEHLTPCAEALEYLSENFPDGSTLSRAAPPLSVSLREGVPAWRGFYVEQESGAIERDAHILFLGHWSRLDIAESEVCRRLTLIEARLFQLYANEARRVGIRDVFQIELFVQVTDSHVVGIGEATKNERRREKLLLPIRPVR